MKHIRNRLALAALATLCASTLPMGHAVAQTSYASARVPAMPRVTAFDVKTVGQVESGTELDFTVWGTPGSAAVLHIDGAQRNLPLTEVVPGRYEGTYTVGRRDRIGPGSKVTANLRKNNQVTTALLAEPLQNGWPSPLAADTTPHIELLDADNEPGRRGRNTVRYTLKGTPGGSASVQIDGSQPSTLTLEEVRPGEYTGVYTLPPGQWLATDHALVGRLRVGDRSTVTTANNAYDDVRLDMRPDNRRWNRMPMSCSDCGHVEQVNRVEVDGNGKVIGTVAGGLLGAVVGSQFGKGDGRTAAGVAGAVGGALLGREIGNRSGHRTQYEVVVRTPSGERRTVNVDEPPTVKVGDAVRLVGDGVEPWRG